MTSNGIYDAQHTITFTETSLIDRLKRFAPFLPKEIPLFATVTISFWGVAEVLSELGGGALSLKNLAAPALVTAFAAASYKAIQKYRNSVPEALSIESTASKSIHRKGRCGWQFALALQMLKERTNSSDRMLQRIEDGANFVAPKILDRQEYLDWIKRRPEILIRLIRAVAIQCTSELPSVLAKPNSDNFLADLKDSVSELSKLYQETVTFELESRSVNPPDVLTKAHEMTFGWSNPIRDGIRKFLEVLEQISQMDPRSTKSEGSPAPSFGIRFDSPQNIDEFTHELKKHF
jgi:hypothetical protein